MRDHRPCPPPPRPRGGFPRSGRAGGRPPNRFDAPPAPLGRSGWRAPPPDPLPLAARTERLPRPIPFWRPVGASPLRRAPLARPARRPSLLCPRRPTVLVALARRSPILTRRVLRALTRRMLLTRAPLMRRTLLTRRAPLVRRTLVTRRARVGWPVALGRPALRPQVARKTPALLVTRDLEALAGIAMLAPRAPRRSPADPQPADALSASPRGGLPPACARDVRARTTSSPRLDAAPAADAASASVPRRRAPGTRSASPRE